MTDHEETIKQAKGHRRNREKVHCSNGFAMIAKKGEPPFRGFRVSRRMTHPAGNGSLGNIESKHQELTMDSWGAPGWAKDRAECRKKAAGTGQVKACLEPTLLDARGSLGYPLGCSGLFAERNREIHRLIRAVHAEPDNVAGSLLIQNYVQIERALNLPAIDGHDDIASDD
jgi:hypothetical protein